MSYLKRILREPLLHFVVAGAVIFWISALLSPERAEGSERRVVVGPGRIDRMAGGFEEAHGRAPTRQELEELVDGHVLEEIFAREARRMKIGREDAALRSKLREKVEILRGDAKALVEPTDVQLAEYLKSHPDRFRTEPLYSFRHVYFDPAAHGPDAQGFLAEQLALVRSGASVAGDPSELPGGYVRTGRGAVQKAFGPEFATELHGLKLGEWSGPVSSEHGLHLVYLEVRLPERMPKLEEIHAIVMMSWIDERRRESMRVLHEELRGKYQVVIDWSKRGGK